MPVLTIREIYDVALAAGFSPHEAVTWTAIALAESGGRTGALNDKGEHSMGLWQVNVAGDVRDNTWGNLNDPAVNARAAFDISRQGRDMRPWTTTHDHNKGTNRDYRTYLDDVEDEIGVKGDPRGVAGYGAPLPPPLESDSFEIDPGRTLDGNTAQVQSAGAVEPNPDVVDTDADGLTDAFEKLAKTDASDADTDDDGLLDGQEVKLLFSNPRDAENKVKDSDSDGLANHVEKLAGTDHENADTDGDLLDDAAEAALGTDPTRADSDHDGMTDGLEVQHNSDPLSSTMGATGTQVATPRWTLDPTDPYAIDDGNGLDLTRLPGAKDNDKDTDSDGLTDAFEKLAGTNRKKADSDNDGLTDGYEALASHTDPLNTDTDNDGTDDATEIATGSDPGRMAGHAGVTGSGAFAENVRDGVTDTDSDGLSDHAEKLLRTDAGKTDTDNDQLDDAAEIALGTNPTLADTDSDGISDGLEAQYGTDPLAAGSTLGTGLTPGLDNGGLATPDPTTPDPTQPGTPEPATAGLYDG